MLTHIRTFLRDFAANPRYDRTNLRTKPFSHIAERRVYLFQLIQVAFTNQATLFVSVRGRW